jgi:hypothetical protein
LRSFGVGRLIGVNVDPPPLVFSGHFIPPEPRGSRSR